MDNHGWEQYSGAELRRIAEILTKLADTKDREIELIQSLAPHAPESPPKNVEGINGAGEKPSHAVPGQNLMAAGNENERKPLRAPRDGTVRSDIYEVMSIKPMAAKDIIKAVARRRGGEPTERLAATVREVLRDRYDAKIEKTGYGLYRLAAENQKGNGDRR